MDIINNYYEKRTISRDLILGLTLAIGLMVTILGTIYYLHTTRIYQKELNARATHITEEFAKVMTLPAWHFDVDMIRQISQAYLSTKDLSAIYVELDEQTVFDNRPSDKKQLIIREKSILRKGDCLGRIELLFTLKSVRQTQRTLIISMLLIICLVIFIIILGTHFIMRSLLNRPLSELIQNIRSIAHGNYQNPLPFVPQHDVNVIIHEVNVMADEIAKREKTLKYLNKTLELRVMQQMEAEDKLRKTQDHIKDIINSMPSVMIGVTPEGQVTHWNTAAEKAIHIQTKDAQNKLLSDVCPELAASQMDNVRMSLNDQIPRKTEKQLRQKGNEIIYEDIMIYPLVSKGAEGAVIRVDNVTRQVRFEEMMIQTEKMRSLGGLAAGMAHEINNPLGVILQSLQNIFRRLCLDFQKNIDTANACGTDLKMIRAYMDQRRIFRYLNGIRDAGNRAARIVANMLNFSRGGQSSKISTDINQLIDSAIELAEKDYDLKKKYDFRQIRIVRDYDTDIPWIRCVAVEIEQVMFNLLKNAAQAMDEMRKKAARSCSRSTPTNEIEPKIVLRTRKNKNYVQIEVLDNGPGMDREICKRIFEPFYTTKPVGNGTGLGLSVSFFIITNNHKGTISVESEFGRGSRFTICLPLTLENDT